MVGSNIKPVEMAIPDDSRLKASVGIMAEHADYSHLSSVRQPAGIDLALA